MDEKEHHPSTRAVDSVRSLWTQMLSAKNSPEVAPNGLLEACATQEKLARFSYEEEQIFPLALNTLKAAAEVLVERGGWASFDQLRREVYASSLPVLQAKRKAKRSLGSQLRDLREEIEVLRTRNQYLLRGRTTLLSAYADAIRMLRESRATSPQLVEKLREHETRFDVRKQMEEVEASDAKSENA
jgi:hypothetical protein